MHVQLYDRCGQGMEAIARVHAHSNCLGSYDKTQVRVKNKLGKVMTCLTYVLNREKCPKVTDKLPKVKGVSLHLVCVIATRNNLFYFSSIVVARLSRYFGGGGRALRVTAVIHRYAESTRKSSQVLHVCSEHITNFMI